MFAGYNTNIFQNNEIYHIQAEDTGQGDSVIVSFFIQKKEFVLSNKWPALMS
jgi:hypothetical protein